MSPSRKSDIGRFAIVPLWVAKRVSPRALTAYIILGTYANDLGECWPSVSTLASEADMHLHTMRAALKELWKMGAIEVFQRERKDGGQTSNLYRLVYAEPAEYWDTPPHKNTEGGVSQESDPPPSQKSDPPIEQDPNEQKTQGALPLNSTWRDQAHPIAGLIYDTIADIPRFAPYLQTNPHQVNHLLELVDEYLDLAPNINAIKASLTNFKTYWQNDRTKKQRVDGVATLRNYLSRSVASWAVVISKQNGKTARQDNLSADSNVKESDDNDIIAEVRRRRESRNGQ